MLLEIDISGAVDIVDNWGDRGLMQNVYVCNHFLPKLKDQGLLIIEFIPAKTNDADIFKKHEMSGVLIVMNTLKCLTKRQVGRVFEVEIHSNL